MIRWILLALAPATSLNATPDPDELIGRLARPAPATVAFTEVRFSPLLQHPLIVSGQLGYSGPASLDRRVTTPYREETAIRGESVRVVREGEPARSFALKRAPELQGLLTGFTALLAGDADALRDSFEIQTSGDDSAWTIELTPTDRRARRRLRQIAVTGQGDEPRCLSVFNTDKGASVLLLGEVAGETLPSGITLETVQRRCAATDTAP